MPKKLSNKKVDGTVEIYQKSPAEYKVEVQKVFAGCEAKLKECTKQYNVK